MDTHVNATCHYLKHHLLLYNPNPPKNPLENHTVSYAAATNTSKHNVFDTDAVSAIK